MRDMAHADLLTRCTTCREEILISRMAAQMARPIECHHCGQPAYLWQLLGRTNREAPPPVNELQGTWEGARA